MPKQKNYTFVCEICGREFTNKSKEKAQRLATECEQSHEVLYVPLTRAQLNRLVQYIYTGSRELLTKELMDTLKSYMRLGD